MIFRNVGCAALLAASLCGCGSGNEPMSILGTPGAKMTDSLGLPYNQATGAVGGGQILLTTYSPFIASAETTDGLDFTYSAAGAYQILAPQAGVVSAADSSSVTILHNVHVSSRLSRLSSVQVRVGDYLSAGSVVGTTSIGGTIFNLVHFSVLVDGAAVCPYGYLAPAAKTIINSTLNSVGATAGPCRE